MSYQNAFVFLWFRKLTKQGCRIFYNIVSKCVDTVSVGYSRLDDVVGSCQTKNCWNNNGQITILANLNTTVFSSIPEYFFKQKKILFFHVWNRYWYHC